MSDSSEPVGFIAPLPTDLAPLFPGYEIQGLIATGGMGAVYCALQKSLDRTVAIKILPMELSKDAAFCAGFEAEAKAMARLNHPNLIGVYDFGEVNGMLYIIMEFVAGKSVYHSAYGTAIDPTEVVRLITAICDGLAHAHENGIIHRDIKPSNILLDLNAQPKIGDFGLARPIGRKIEEGEEIFGTPHYTAPEVVDHPHSVDHRADIFSLGVMLHELLTGKLPATDPRPASSIVRCDPRLDAIIRRATQPLPAARYSSAAEMATDLRAISSSKASTGPRTGPIRTNPPAPVRRKYPTVKKKSSSGSAAFVLLALTVVGAYFYLTKEPPPAPIPAPTTATSPPKQIAEIKKNIPEETQIEDPELAPDPKPETEIKPEMATSDPTQTPSVVEPITPDPEVPKFDVPAFFDKARKIMLDRCKSSLTAHETALKSNVDDLEKACKRVFRKLPADEETAIEVMTEYIQEWKEEKFLIPSLIPTRLLQYSGTAEAYEEAVEAQALLDEKLQAELTSQAAVYILGLEKEIERRKADNDPGAVTLIQEEIDQTKETPKHFFKLMVGRNPQSASSADP